MQLPASLKLYLKSAIESRRLRVRRIAARIALATIATVVLLVGLALLNVAFFLAIRPMLGDLGAVLLIAVVHVVTSAVLAILALRDPLSADPNEHAKADLLSFAPIGAVALEALQEQTRQNISLFEKAMSLWSPFKDMPRK